MQLLNPLERQSVPGQDCLLHGYCRVYGHLGCGRRRCCVWATTAAYIVVGEGVTATTSSTPIPANVPVPFIVPKGTGAPWRVSAIQVASGGSVYAKPISGN
jgi:hypothetical protein